LGFCRGSRRPTNAVLVQGTIRGLVHALTKAIGDAAINLSFLTAVYMSAARAINDSTTARQLLGMTPMHATALAVAIAMKNSFLRR
jgi:hypothetical protein